MIGVGPDITYATSVGTPQAAASIVALVVPASTVLGVGKALMDTPNWDTFLNSTNYVTTASDETIDTVTVNYIGDTAAEDEPFAQADSNNFSITVVDTGGNTYTFPVMPRTVANTPPVYVGTLSPVEFQQGLGPQVYEDAQGAFTGSNLIYSVSGANDIVIRSDGNIEVDTDLILVQTDTSITVTAANSGGADSGATTLTILPTTVNFTGLIDGVADLDSFAGISGQLNNGRDIDGYQWGSTLGGSEYGSGINPTAFTAGTVYVEVTAGINTYSASITASDLLKFDTQPTFGEANYTVGDTLVLNEGTASPSATLSVEYFRLDGVDKSGELSGLNWDSTGEAAGIVTAQIRATNVDGFVLSDEITTILNAAAGATAPMINNMIVDALSGNDLPVVFDFSENEPTPYKVPIVLVPTGTTAPSSAQVAAGTDAFDNPAPFAGFQFVSAAGTATFSVGTAPSGTYDLYATVEDADGHLWDSVAVQENVILNFSTLSLTRLGAFLGTNTSATTTSFIIDATGLMAGDKLLLPYGVRAHPTSMTVTETGEAAAAATQVGTNPTAGGAAYNSLHLFELTKAGAAGLEIVVNTAASVNEHVLVPHVIKGGTVPTSGTAVNHVYRSTGPAALSAPVTPTGSNGLVFAFAIGPDGYIDDGTVTWGGDVQLIETGGPAVPSNRNISTAGVATSTTAEVAVTLTPATGGPMSLVAVAISED